MTAEQLLNQNADIDTNHILRFTENGIRLSLYFTKASNTSSVNTAINSLLAVYERGCIANEKETS